MAVLQAKVSLPKPLFERMVEFVKNHPEAGFNSASDLAKHAVIAKLEDLEKKFDAQGEAVARRTIEHVVRKAKEADENDAPTKRKRG